MRKQTMNSLWSLLGAGSLAVAVSLTPAGFSAAQQSPGEQATDTARSPGTQREADAGSAERSGAGRQSKVDPSGWVRIAADYDGDGQMDAVETIYYVDLQQARRSSAQRQAEREENSRQAGEERRNQGARSERSMRPAGRDQASGERRMHRVSGALRDIRTVRLRGMQEPHVVARVRGEDGRTARVLLGTESAIPMRELRDAEEVTVRGFSGRVNDRSILVAERITMDGETTLRVDNRPPRELRHLQGELASTRTARFRGFESPFVIGQVRLRDGDQVTVNFGPRDSLRDRIQLEQGMQLSLLARPGTINQERAWIAEQLNAQGRSISLNQPSRQAAERARLTRREAEDRSRRAYRGEATGGRDDAGRVTYDGTERAALGIFVAESGEGMEIARVLEGSPAERVGLQVGDQLLTIGGTPVDTYREVVRSLQIHDPRETILVRVRRDGQTRTFRVTLQPRPRVYDETSRDR